MILLVEEFINDPVLYCTRQIHSSIRKHKHLTFSSNKLLVGQENSHEAELLKFDKNISN